MIIDNFDRFRACVVPYETDAPFVVDPNTMLTGAIAFQSFEPVSRQRHQIPRMARLMNLTKFALRRALYVLRQFFRKPAMEESFRITVCEGSNHRKI
jgi:hypothetical protein